MSTATVPPTSAEIDQAEVAAPDVEKIPKLPADLVPGDAFVAYDQVRLCVDFPEIYPGSGTVMVPVQERPAFPVERLIHLQVISWQGRTVNYGRRKCGDCGCNVTRDHDAQECRDLQWERRAKIEDDL